jgi:hypothetical protein
MKKVIAIKCNECSAIFQRTKNKISFQGKTCPFCGVTGIDNKKVLQTVTVNKSELTTEE